MNLNKKIKLDEFIDQDRTEKGEEQEKVKQRKVADASVEQDKEKEIQAQVWNEWNFWKLPMPELGFEEEMHTR